MFHVFCGGPNVKTETLFKAEGLKKYFPIKGSFFRTVGWVRAVDGVNFEVKTGEIFGLVGESGCGKTTLARLMLRLIEPTGGKIIFEGVNLCALTRAQMRKMRRHMQIIFQDPYSSLNPRMIVKDILSEPLQTHVKLEKHQREERISELLELVGLSAEHKYRYPHEFSGGQRQRIAIARALSLNPKFLVLDEPTSALDVSVQAQILNLLMDLQEKLGLTYVFISHNINVIQHLSDRIAVMYLGKIVEISNAEEIFLKQAHPYTQALLAAVPIPDPKMRREGITLKGEVPSPANPPSGCRFHTRCVLKKGDICEKEEPPLIDIGHGHLVACHLYT
jgi:oligopeptide/dipeptide ABC transporter ATP-binding protein